MLPLHTKARFVQLLPVQLLLFLRCSCSSSTSRDLVWVWESKTKTSRSVRGALGSSNTSSVLFSLCALNLVLPLSLMLRSIILKETSYLYWELMKIPWKVRKPSGSVPNCNLLQKDGVRKCKRASSSCICFQIPLKCSPCTSSSLCFETFFYSDAICRLVCIFRSLFLIKTSIIIIYNVQCFHPVSSLTY